MATKEKKINFIKRVYFGTTDNPTDDVNPYSNLEEFGCATVGTLRWGIDEQVRQRSKIRFAYNFNNVLNHYNVILSVEDIFTALNDDKINNDIVLEWVEKSQFN